MSPASRGGFLLDFAVEFLLKDLLKKARPPVVKVNSGLAHPVTSNLRRLVGNQYAAALFLATQTHSPSPSAG